MCEYQMVLYLNKASISLKVNFLWVKLIGKEFKPKFVPQVRLTFTIREEGREEWNPPLFLHLN